MISHATTVADRPGCAGNGYGRLLKLTERINEVLEQQLLAVQTPPKPSTKSRAA